MRLWELVIDCWTDAAQANTTSLRWIGISDIVNKDVRLMILKEIQGHGRSGNPRTGQVIAKPDSITWGQNHFIRSAKHVANALNKRLVSATQSSTDTEGALGWASNDFESDDLFLEMDMVLELR